MACWVLRVTAGVRSREKIRQQLVSAPAMIRIPNTGFLMYVYHRCTVMGLQGCKCCELHLERCSKLSCVVSWHFLEVPHAGLTSDESIKGVLSGGRVVAGV